MFCQQAREITSSHICSGYMQKSWMLTPFHAATQEKEKSTDVDKM
jgi:hypothetical protein